MMLTYPATSDYYSRAIKFNTLCLTKFFLRLALFAEANAINKRQILNKLRLCHVPFVLCK